MTTYYEAPRRLILREVGAKNIGEEPLLFAENKQSPGHVVYEISPLTFKDTILPQELHQDVVVMQGNQLQMTMKLGSSSWIYVSCEGLPENSVLRIRHSKAWGTFFDFKTNKATAYVVYPVKNYWLEIVDSLTDNDQGCPYLLMDTNAWNNTMLKHQVVGQGQCSVLRCKMQQIPPYCRLRVLDEGYWLDTVSLPSRPRSSNVRLDSFANLSTLPNLETEFDTLLLKHVSFGLPGKAVLAEDVDYVYLRELPIRMTEQELLLYFVRQQINTAAFNQKTYQHQVGLIAEALTAIGIQLEQGVMMPLKEYLESPLALHNQTSAFKAYLSEGRYTIPIFQYKLQSNGIKMTVSKVKANEYRISMEETEAQEVVTSIKDIPSRLCALFDVNQDLQKLIDAYPYLSSVDDWDINSASVKVLKIQNLNGSAGLCYIPVHPIVL